MATSDLPAEAVEAAATARMWQYDSEHDAAHLSWPHFVAEVTPVLAAAAPHLRAQADAEIDRLVAVVGDLRAQLADTRARVRAEVNAALDRMPYGPHGLLRAQDIKEILADTLGAGGDGEG